MNNIWWLDYFSDIIVAQIWDHGSYPLQWRHMSVMKSQITDNWAVLFNSLFGLRKKKTSELCINCPFVRALVIGDFRSALRWHHNERDGVSNHQPHDCLFNRLFRRRSKKTSKFRVTGHCAGNSLVTGEFPHMGAVTRKMFPFDDVIMESASNDESVSMSWRLRSPIWSIALLLSATCILMTSSNRNIIRVTGPLWPVNSPHKGQ